MLVHKLAKEPRGQGESEERGMSLQIGSWQLSLARELIDQACLGQLHDEVSTLTFQPL